MSELKFQHPDGYEVTVNYETSIPHSSLTALSHVVTNAVFNQEFGYTPALRDVSFYHSLLVAYTDYDIDLDETFRLMNESDLFSQLLNVIDGKQLAYLSAWIDDMIDYHKKMDGTAMLLSMLNRAKFEENEEEPEEENKPEEKPEEPVHLLN